jgi:hypothetical protein
MSEVISFDAGDEPYLSWLSDNPQGWVLNVDRQPEEVLPEAAPAVLRFDLDASRSRGLHGAGLRQDLC